jgi:hypothetical protein
VYIYNIHICINLTYSQQNGHFSSNIHIIHIVYMYIYIHTKYTRMHKFDLQSAKWSFLLEHTYNTHMYICIYIYIHTKYTHMHKFDLQSAKWSFSLERLKARIP